MSYSYKPSRRGGRGRAVRWLLITIVSCLCWAYIGTPPVAAASSVAWGPYRGVDVEPSITRGGIADLSHMGANVIRLSFDGDPLIEAKPPYKLNTAAFDKLDKILGWCRRYNIGVVLDPHTPPGTKSDYTTVPSDSFWHSRALQSEWVRLWQYIARRYRGNEVIVGYDLLNSPSAQAGYPKGALSWAALSRRIAKTIREQGDEHWLIIETAVSSGNDNGRPNSMSAVTKLQLPATKKVVVEVHMYEPLAFTFQGTHGRRAGLQFPGRIGNKHKLYDAAYLKKLFVPVRKFQEEHHVPIFVGEFSASIYAGASGNRYIADLLSLFNGYGWSWAYQQFRQSRMWDAEYPILNPKCRVSKCAASDNTARMKLLRQYW